MIRHVRRSVNGMTLADLMRSSGAKRSGPRPALGLSAETVCGGPATPGDLSRENARRASPKSLEAWNVCPACLAGGAS